MKDQDESQEWTASLAYAVGLITTDGCLSKDGRHIIFRSSDYQLAETFNLCLGSSSRIVKTKKDSTSWSVKPSYRIQHSNAHLYRWLLTIGLFPAKSKTIKELLIPDIYFPDFIRGHLDGDGTVRMYIDRYNVYRDRRYTNLRVLIQFISASEAHIIWLQKRISELTGCNGAIISVSNQKRPTPMWQLKFSKKEALSLIRWMYYQPDLPCLKRKEEIAKKSLLDSQSTVRKSYSFISQ